jgi:tetratricopeptide (TPR) repeat protein/predicted Ser/Thr protein kinase
MTDGGSRARPAPGSDDDDDDDLSGDPGARPTVADTPIATSNELAAPLERGAQVGRYLVLGRLGEGGMGVVYNAYDPELDRKVALKLLRAAPSRRRGGQESQARLLREAQALARISHPNVVPVYDVGTYQERVFIAMEFVEGTTVKKWVKQKQRSWREVLEVFIAAGRGLAAAHAAGLVHRDFKPENVLVGRDGRVRVMDFGLARVEETESNPSVSTLLVPLRSDDSVLHKLGPLTQEGRVLGTPNYMSPEQYMGRALDARSDQFSFCAALYYGLYRKKPFEPAAMAASASALFKDGEPTQAATASVDASSVPALRGPIQEPPREIRVPAWIRRVTMRGLSLNPEERFASMEALLEELSRDPWVQRRRWLTAAAAVAVAVAGGALYQRQSSTEQLCRGGERRLAGVWDQEVERQVIAAFGKSDKPYADAALATARDGLDAYARDWVAMHRETCEATRIRGEQTEQVQASRMLCLERRLKDLRAVTGLLAAAGGATIDRAAEAVQALPRISRCADVEALMSQVPPPEDPASREKLEKISSLLSEARALDGAGQFRPALDIARKAQASADELRHQPLRAEAQSILGWLQVKTGDLVPGEATLMEGVYAAVAGRHDEELLLLAIRLVYAFGVSSQNLAEGQRWEKLARATLQRLGGEHELEIDLQSTLGAMYSTHGQMDLARGPMERAAALAERLPEASFRRAHVLSSLSAFYLDSWEPERAIPVGEKSLELLLKMRGPLHPLVAYAHLNMANALRMRGDHGSALSHAQKALSIREAALGPEHPLTARAHEVIGTIFNEQGRHREAVTQLERSADIRGRAGPDDPEMRHPWAGLGIAYRGLGDTRRAISFLERALRLCKDDQVVGADVRFALAQALWDARVDRARARTLAAEARAQYRSVGYEQVAAKVDRWLQSNGP